MIVEMKSNKDELELNDDMRSRQGEVLQIKMNLKERFGEELDRAVRRFQCNTPEPYCIRYALHRCTPEARTRDCERRP